MAFSVYDVCVRAQKTRAEQKQIISSLENPDDLLRVLREYEASPLYFHPEIIAVTQQRLRDLGCSAVRVIYV